MRKFALLFAVVLMGAAAPALAQSVDDPASAEPVVDPAPSGVELSNATVDSNGVTVEQPGVDAPVSDTHEGNREVIDFDPEGHTGTADADR